MMENWVRIGSYPTAANDFVRYYRNGHGDGSIRAISLAKFLRGCSHNSYGPEKAFADMLQGKPVYSYQSSAKHLFEAVKNNDQQRARCYMRELMED